MSITLYTGTPGSGKSFHAAKDIVQRLKRGGGLICNFPVNENCVGKRLKAHVEYWDNSELTASRLVAYAMEHHEIGKEGQTLVVIDECQIIFNCRDFGRKDRNAWVTFFSQHRKLGFNVILITQSDRMLDRQIRSLVEEEVKHRKLNNYGFGGMFLTLFTFGRTWFISINYWYGGNKLKLGENVFPYRKRYAEVYDSYKLFSDMVPAEDDQEQKTALVLALLSVLRQRQRELAVLPAPRLSLRDKLLHELRVLARRMKRRWKK